MGLSSLYSIQNSCIAFQYNIVGFARSVCFHGTIFSYFVKFMKQNETHEYLRAVGRSLHFIAFFLSRNLQSAVENNRSLRNQAMIFELIFLFFLVSNKILSSWYLKPVCFTQIAIMLM